jgi:hypothetical protein
MATKSLEARVAELELIVQELRQSIGNGASSRPWHVVTGMFPDDEAMHRITDPAKSKRKKRTTKPKRGASALDKQ